MSQDRQKEDKHLFLKKPKFILCAAAMILIAVLCVIFKYMALALIMMLLFAIGSIMITHKILRKRNGEKSQEVTQCALADNEINKLAQYFVGRDEKYISSLGNGYIMNYLANGSLSTGFSVISNKRVYFRGSCYSGQGKSLVKTDEERTVDIKDVTGSGFIYRRHIGVLLGLLMALIVLLGVFCLSMLSFQKQAEYYQKQATEQMEFYRKQAEFSLQLAEDNPQRAEVLQKSAEDARKRAEYYMKQEKDSGNRCW